MHACGGGEGRALGQRDSACMCVRGWRNVRAVRGGFTGVRLDGTTLGQENRVVMRARRRGILVRMSNEHD